MSARVGSCTLGLLVSSLNVPSMMPHSLGPGSLCASRQLWLATWTEMGLSAIAYVSDESLKAIQPSVAVGLSRVTWCCEDKR